MKESSKFRQYCRIECTFRRAHRALGIHDQDRSSGSCAVPISLDTNPAEAPSRISVRNWTKSSVTSSAHCECERSLEYRFYEVVRPDSDVAVERRRRHAQVIRDLFTGAFARPLEEAVSVRDL